MLAVTVRFWFIKAKKNFKAKAEPMQHTVAGHDDDETLAVMVVDV